MAGYSPTPLAKKLGIKPGTIIFTIAAPDGYAQWLAPLPDKVSITAKTPASGAETVHLFADSIAALERGLPRARQSMKGDGALWVSWPKKSSGVRTDVTEDAIRARALKTDLVDVKVCAVTDIWSGLKLVVRKHLR